MVLPLKQFSFSITYEYAEHSQEVLATLQPSFDQKALSSKQISADLKERAYQDFFVFSEAIDELLITDELLRAQGQKLLKTTLAKLAKQQTDNPEQAAEEPKPENIFALLNKPLKPFVIAQKRNAEVAITTSDDDIIAYLSIYKPFGGEPATEGDVFQAIADAGIASEIDQSTVARALEQGQAEQLVLAKGSKPKRGGDSRFVPLIEVNVYKGPAVDEDGKTNYKELFDFVVVEPGTALMRRESPEPGKNGMDVFGKSIPAEPGESIPFSTDLEGAMVSESDLNILVATEKGHPVYSERGASIDQVLRLKSANLATGNIEFDGSVCINEDVADGISVKATGDVSVLGTVGKATIEAGNNVIIRQGLIGGTKSNEDEDDSEPYGAFIKAGASVSALFASYAKIEAQDEISIREYASHCGLFAEHKVLLGKNMGKGNLIGGQAQAFELIYAKVLGSTGGTPTRLRIGAKADTILQLRKISQQLHSNKTQLSENAEALQKIAIWTKVAGMNEQNKEKIAHLNKENETIEASNIALNEQANALKLLLMRTKRANVTVGQKVFPNAEVAVLNYSQRIKEEQGGGQFRFDARQVSYRPR